MNTERDDGGPVALGFIGHRPSMTLRDWLAGQALAGMVIGCSGILGREKDGSEHFSAYAKGPCNSVLADRAYALADAMLKARQK